MFEIAISCVILFAVGYWSTLFIMGRREDVLHGEFVEAEPELMPAQSGASMSFPVVKPAPAPLPVEAAPRPEPIPAPAVATLPATQPVLSSAPVNRERLQSLLVSIKQELKHAAQI